VHARGDERRRSRSHFEGRYAGLIHTATVVATRLSWRLCGWSLADHRAAARPVRNIPDKHILAECALWHPHACRVSR
jgi:hypothetical protein